MGLLLGIIAQMGGGSSSSTPTTTGEGIAFAPSGDWVIASHELTGADSYRLYLNTENNINTATLFYDGPLNEIEAVPMKAGLTNFIWWVPVTGGVEGTAVAGSIVIPSNILTEQYSAIGDSNTSNSLSTPYGDQLGLDNLGLSGWGIARWMDGFWNYAFNNISPTAINRVTVMLGTNAEGVTSGATQFANLQAFTERLHNYGFQVIVMAPAKLNSPYDPDYFQDFSDAIEAGAEDLKAYTTFTMLDLTHVGDNLNYNTPPKDDYWVDAIHYSTLGQTEIADAIEPLIDAQRLLWVKKPSAPTNAANSGSGATNTRNATTPTGYIGTDCQCTTDTGLTWQDCSGAGTTASFIVGNVKREIGTVGIRMKGRYVGPLKQWNPPSEIVWNTAAFSSTFTVTDIAYDDASIVTTGAGWIDDGTQWRTQGLTDYIEIPFTRGIEQIEDTVFGSTGTVFKYEVDGVEITQLDLYGKAGKLIFSYFSGDNDPHTLKISRGANEWLSAGTTNLEVAGFRIYS